MARAFKVRVPETPPNEYISKIMKRASNPKPEKYNILTFATHERYQTLLAKTGHNFYSFGTEGIKEWNTDFGEIPENYYILPKEVIFKGIKMDFILSQSKFGQFQVATLINKNLNLPIVSLEHTSPTSVLKPEWLEEIKGMVGDINIFISDYSKNEWKLNTDNELVIHHGLDAELFRPLELERKPYALSVVNDFKNRDYCCNYTGWERITSDLETKVVGANEGLSEPAPSIQALVEEYNSAQVFLNTSTVSPVPTSMLEAMACGCAVVTTATCMIPEVIEHGKNGMMSNNESELNSYVKQLLGDEDLRKRLGEEARKTVLEKFSEKDFLQNWNNIFDQAYEVIK